VVKMTGDGLHAAFDDALDALAATVDLQQALADPAATHGVPLRVRCGLHAGVVERRDNDYFGGPVNRAARIVGAAHGGQVLLSQAVAALVSNRLPPGVTLRDLGRVRLRDLASPEHVYQLAHAQLRETFPALRTLEATPNNLAQQLTSFVGRKRELEEVRALLRKNRLLTLVSNMFTNMNLSDMETCYKVFRREIADKIEIKSRTFAVEPEFAAKVAKLKARVYEVPITYSGRDYSEGKKIGPKDALIAFWAIVRWSLFA